MASISACWKSSCSATCCSSSFCSWISTLTPTTRTARQGTRKGGHRAGSIIGVQNRLPVTLGAHLRARRQAEQRQQLLAPQHLGGEQVNVEHTDLAGLLRQLQPVFGLLHGDLGPALLAD